MTPTTQKPALNALILTALGVVYGDLGTSPLYTLKTVLLLAGNPNPAAVLGLLSLLIWTLVMITSVKYVFVVMRVDNDGEGGILALMSLLGVQRAQRPLIVLLGLFGAALIYGDGIITPAISVLSALEGLTMATPHLTPYVLPLTVAVLAALFLVQPLGTARIGKMFGPVMLLWFLTIGGLGLCGVVQHLGVLRGLNPLWGVNYLLHGGRAAFAVMGGVFLCVTGAEALYADMGHVGAQPIRLAWYGLVLPSLLLNYAGQAGIVLDGKVGGGNIFFMLCPPSALIALILLSTAATIIASQSIITGAFSMTRQAIQLGWCPRLKITQTSAEGFGQIYVGTINWMMMILTIALALGFRKSDNLASAYGIAVSLTMFLTTCLLFVAMREIWKWRLPAAVAAAGVFAVIDAGFVAANSLKIMQGGWIPLALAAIVYGLMLTWHRGTQGIAAAMPSRLVPAEEFLRDVTAAGVARVPGTAVFLTRSLTGTPPMMLWHVKTNRALHQYLVALSIQVLPVPWVDPARRVDVETVAPGFWRLTATYGFMEQPDIPTVIAAAHAQGCAVKLDDVTYYVGHETVSHRQGGKGMSWWREEIFAFMLRNSAQAADFFRLPREDVVEIGRQIEV